MASNWEIHYSHLQYMAKLRNTDQHILQCWFRGDYMLGTYMKADKPVKCAFSPEHHISISGGQTATKQYELGQLETIIDNAPKSKSARPLIVYRKLAGAFSPEVFRKAIEDKQTLYSPMPCSTTMSAHYAQIWMSGFGEVLEIELDPALPFLMAGRPCSECPASVNPAEFARWSGQFEIVLPSCQFEMLEQATIKLDPASWANLDLQWAPKEIRTAQLQVWRVKATRWQLKLLSAH